ncbi:MULTISPECIES: sulfite exporter TauE/SafE family protein [unclassified Fusibacter]|uniref:urease accessory protein UreH domain-containing protein n=1 Tax=unclassified Fusibacter TaxID=2624464 RepID=UPI0013E9709E|nr:MULTISPECIES: sulfite exporter TauE/SafE family protein [unclassified Fusibacter]MCK8060140.1 sulfite exporter TauE/SafE family protein [Fusibacter sp. A2]NPE22282.1 hypothetical protein [Fusibacter sp. A1]
MKYTLKIDGMTCASCKKRVEKIVGSMDSVTAVRVNLDRHTLTFEADVYDKTKLSALLEKDGYAIAGSKSILGTILLVAVLLGLLYVSNQFYGQYGSSSFSGSLGMIGAFIFGLLTSFHCVGMCGGIALSRAKSEDKVRNFIASIQYNFGRILTYSVIGGFLGLIGQAVTITFKTRGLLFLLIGAVMLLIGLHNSGIIRWRINLPVFFRLKTKNESSSSFFVGILNGFMPCGPLQTMQLFVLSTMSFIKGFTYMMAFGLGTLTLMMLLGNIGAFIPKKYNRYVLKTSGLVVIFMAMLIINQGLVGFGLNLPLSRLKATAPSYTVSSFELSSEDTLDFAPIEDGYQIVNMTVKRFYDLENVKVKKDIPVRIVMDVVSLSPCIDTITIPEYEVVKGLAVGTEEMIFTPNKSGDVVITCWMNMVTTYLEVE